MYIEFEFQILSFLPGDNRRKLSNFIFKTLFLYPAKLVCVVYNTTNRNIGFNFKISLYTYTTQFLSYSDIFISNNNLNVIKEI